MSFENLEQQAIASETCPPAWGTILDGCTIYEQISKRLIPEETAVVWICEFMLHRLETIVGGNKMFAETNAERAESEANHKEILETTRLYYQITAAYEGVVFGHLHMGFSVWSGCKPLLKPAYGKDYSLSDILSRAMEITGETFPKMLKRLGIKEFSFETMLSLANGVDDLIGLYSLAPKNRLLFWMNKRHVVRRFMNDFYRQHGTAMTFYRTSYPYYYLSTYYR